LRVKLDLRPENVKNVPPPKTRKTGLLMFCMFIIFGSVVCFAWVLMGSDIAFISSQIETLTEKIEELTARENRLQKELNDLEKQERMYAQSLNIMQYELPTIEVFDSIEKSIVRGVILITLSLTQKELKLNGAANNEDNIVTSARNLLDSEVYNIAQVPKVERSGTGPEGLKFSLSLEPKPIQESGRK
jgi:Tfp pilus assembly protein PilN